MNLSKLKILDNSLKVYFRLFSNGKLKPDCLQEPPASILVIKLSAMGDALSLMPSVRMLSLAFPDSKIEWLTTYRVQPILFHSIPFLHRIHLMPVNTLKLIWFIFRFFQKVRRFQLIIDYDQYYQISELISCFGKINAGFLTDLKGRSFAISERYRPLLNEKLQFRALTENIISRWGRQFPEYSPALPELLQLFQPSPRLLEAVEALRSCGKPILAIYPGSSANAIFRRWDLSGYMAIIEKYKHSCVIVIAGGPDEMEIKHRFSSDINGVVDWIGNWSLLEWCWIFKNVISVSICNDGGLFHLADSQNAPIVGIFGPSLFRKWGSINKLSIGIEVDIECRPCLKNYLGQVPIVCHRGDLACMRLIKPYAVNDAVKRTLTLSGYLV
jgi:ADP-heptose:LPS heptosyltransferase